MRLGEVIRKWRISKERTLEDVSGEIGISIVTLSRLELGRESDGSTVSAVLKWLLSSDKTHAYGKRKRGA